MQNIKKYSLGIAVLLFVYFIFKQRKNIKNMAGLLPQVTEKHIVSTNEIIRALEIIKENFGGDIAKMVEKIYRLETAHFKSTQFLLTYSAGMMKFKNTFPYGWGNFRTLWTVHPSFAPIGYAKIFVKRENKDFYYLAFPSLVAAMTALATYIKANGPLRWNSTDKKAQAEYGALLNKISVKYVA